MQYYVPQMLPEYVEVEPGVFQPYGDATVAGWRNEQRLATQQGKHQRAFARRRLPKTLQGVADAFGNIE